MNSKKFFSRAAIAGVAAAALVVTGATAASARDAGNGDEVASPQTNGSLDAYFLLNGGTGQYVETDANDDGWLDTAFAPSTTLFAVYNNDGTPGQAATYDAIDPVVATGGNAWDQVYVVLDDNISAGRSSWSAWTQSNPGTGVNAGKVPAFENLTLSAKTGGSPGINAVLAAGGTYQHGLVFTTNNGQTVIGAIYRTVDITAGGTYRISTVETVAPPTSRPTLAQVQAEAGDGGASFTAPTAGQETVTVAGLANSTTYRALLYTSAVPGGTGSPAPYELTGDEAAVGVNGQLTLDLSTLVGSPLVFTGGETQDFYIALVQPGNGNEDNLLEAVGPVNLIQSANSIDANVDIDATGAFALSIPANSEVDFGTVLRGASANGDAPVRMTVIEDRAVLAGWRVMLEATDFVDAAGGALQSFSKNALGFGVTPAAGTPTDLLTVAATKAAGATTAASSNILEGARFYGTGVTGYGYDLNLSFLAPTNVDAGAYKSTVTLTLEGN